MSLYFVKERARQRLGEIEDAVIRERVALGPLQFEQNGAVQNGGVGVGFSWTDAEAASWLRGLFAVPQEWAGGRVGLVLRITGGEPLLFLSEQPAQALDWNHHDVLLFDPAQGGENGDFSIECYAPTKGATQEIKALYLVLIDRVAYAYFYDFRVCVQLLDVLDENTSEGKGVRVALAQSMDALNFTRGAKSDAFYKSVPPAQTALRDGFFARFPASEGRDARMVLAGHSHIDLAYLWALPNTRKKVGRTFSTVLRLMDEFPDYQFTQSQSQLYAYAKADYPTLYEGIKQRVAERRWEPTGGMWVEADCNVTGGESLIRQILWGNRFFQTEFGVQTRVLWLPDVFGYSAALPQIIKGCGMEYFLTSKISWNQFNRLPYDTFFWRGLDGTEVLTHFVTSPSYHAQLQQHTFTYNGRLTAEEVKGAWDAYQQKAVNDELIDLFGYGDGGGGPTRAMLETGKRLANVAGVPKSTFGKAEPFFDRLHARVKNNPLTPKWVGELYLENHRGTLTSQGRIKRANRVGENLLRGAELFGSLASILAGEIYNQAALNTAWEKLLLNQFHDIFPGTCVPEAIAQAMVDYETVHDAARSVLDAALDMIAARVQSKQNAVVVFNPTDTLRPAAAVQVSVPASVTAVKGGIEFSDESGAPLPHQRVGAVGKGGANAPVSYLVAMPEVGAMGYQTLSVGRAGGPPETSNLRAEPRLLENDYVRVQFDDAGEIVSLVHKIYDDEDEESVTEREAVAPGQTLNALVVYEDKPYAYDGWNVEIFAYDKPYPLRDIGTIESIAVLETGPVRAALQIKRKFLASTLTQTIYLYSHSPRLEFHTVVDWQERQMLLKAVFPADVQSTRATYDIQFGCVERPSHRNTSWDVARFEVCGHKWADVSEGDWGLSVLSDSKYGWDCHDNVLRLSLLRAGTHPDPHSDRGENVFSYALLPHTGDWRTETVDEAHAFNFPLLSRYAPANTKGDLPATFALASVDDQGIIIETVKQAESGDGFIVRLYETFNTRGRATLTLGFPVAEAFAVNLVEEKPEPITFEPTENDGAAIAFDFRPFEIKTFLVKPTQ